MRRPFLQTWTRLRRQAAPQILVGVPLQHQFLTELNEILNNLLACYNRASGAFASAVEFGLCPSSLEAWLNHWGVYWMYVGSETGAGTLLEHSLNS